MSSASHVRLGGSVFGAMVPIVSPRRAPAPSEPTAVREESLLDFAQWLAAQLRMTVRPAGPQIEISLPEEDRELFGGREALRLSLVRGRLMCLAHEQPQGTQRQQQVEPLIWLLERLTQLGLAANPRPAEQPMAVHAIASKLFRAYQVDAGQSHLAGCQLEDRPFVRLTYGGRASLPGTVLHVFVAADGSSVPDEVVKELGLARIVPTDGPPPRIQETKLKSLIAAGQRMAAQQFDSRNPAPAVGQPIAVAILWTKYARGRLRFSIGEKSVDLPFEGWASTLAAPAYHCPHTESETFHLAAVDDGRIVAAEHIVTCDESGQRVLASEVVTCRATGRHVLPEFTTKCPVLAEPVLSNHFAPCGSCGEHVSEPALARGTCAACRGLKPIAADDPRLMWLSGEHPTLAKWKWLRLAETETCYIVRASGLVRRLLVVCDRETLAIRRLAKGSRGSGRWTPIPCDEASLSPDPTT